MILTKQVNIFVKGISIKRYKYLGYDVDTKNKNIIKVKDLPKGSNVKILVKCDKCSIEKHLRLRYYYLSFKYGKYLCNTCSFENYKKTMLKKYGVENSFQLNDVKKLSKETKRNKYDNEKYNNRNKAKETCIEKYGVENPQQFKTIKEKTNKTNKTKYNFTVASKNEDVKKKMKKHNLDKWGSVCTLHSDLLKDDIKKIFIKKYGVDNPMKNYEIMKKSQINSLKRKQFTNTELLYQGTYELDFLVRYYNKINIKNGKSIKYTLNEKIKMYHSDFYISKLNLIIEIKSSYWYNKYLTLNILKKEQCELLGYDYIIIIDKDYIEFDEKIKDYIS